MSNITLTFAYSFPATFGGEPVMQYNFINPITFQASGTTIAQFFADACLRLGYPELEQFASELYNSLDATVEVDSALKPNLLNVVTELDRAGVFRVDPWKKPILLNIINI